MFFYDNTKYGYLIGRLRVLETHLLSQNHIERMLGVKTAEEAFKVLYDLDYTPNRLEIEKPQDFEHLLKDGLRETKEFLAKFVPYQESLDILWLFYDIHNIKVLLRAKHLHLPESEIENNVIRLGKVSHNLLEKYVFSKTYGEKIPAELKKTIDDAESIYEETKDIKKLDAFLDKHYFVLSKKALKPLKNLFLESFLKIEIDIYNIKTALRLKYRNQQDCEWLVSDEKGDIPVSIFEKYLKDETQPLSSLAELIKHPRYNLALKKGLHYFEEHRSFIQLDIELENIPLQYMQQGKRVTFGPEPVLSYFWARKNNANILRTIMIGKLNQLDSKTIKHHLPHLYI